jgi:predicted GIY-YIG superfamily endonuclease
MRITLYCIKGNTGEYYVGKAVNLPRRLYEHRIGRGAQVTKKWSSFELVMSHVVECTDEADARRLERGYANGIRWRFMPELVHGPGRKRIRFVTKNTEKKMGKERE